MGSTGQALSHFTAISQNSRRGARDEDAEAIQGETHQSIRSWRLKDLGWVAKEASLPQVTKFSEEEKITGVPDVPRNNLVAQ